MKTIAAALVLLVTSLPLSAQNGVQNQPPNGDKTKAPTFLDLGTLPGAGCPIGMAADQGVWDHTIRVHQGQRDKLAQPFGQRIILTLSDAHSATIVAATVNVRGLTARNHMVQTAGDGKSNGEASRTLSVTFAANGKGRVTGDLYIPGFTAVNSIELLQVSYNDGRVWRIGAGNVCRVKPDPMMLIANH
jgi:hypothetical protein